ncbi:membrane aminopeptidase [Heterostelium album PN500]|uniref:Aminopeptidase n=1 Tax=Heterostelium pallidum (strain ATCC 26659 / Pp 5 / PN500) TaxID=670386 RepID=D3BPD2_HETP5|nr:membrane aminopeptidase [Heterostelium album PN500]EFA77142.1 membrane aminopeptidase [Heterostelium album PN500]|eukprot:XP_020429271.1 membrane aminopeptidase [Heterostelium album PN500]
MRNLQHIQLKEVESFDDDEQNFELDDHPKKKFYHPKDASAIDKLRYLLKDGFAYITATNTRKAILLTAIFLIFLTLTLTVSFSTRSSKPKIPGLIYSDLKLPSWIKPVHYLAHVTTFMSNDTFSGDIVITLNITTSNNEDYIVVHGDEFVLDSARLEVLKSVSTSYPDSYTAPQSSISADKITFDKNNTYYIIQFDKLSKYLSDGNQYFKLYISYHSNLTDSLKGYYISKYDEIGNTKKKLAMTQFEPTDARLTFPCFDEPAFKANWTIWMDIDGDYNALSNMESIETKVNGDRKLVKFGTTPKMSTYLVCIITHQYTQINDTVDLGKGRSIIVRIWSSLLQSNQTAYPLEAASLSIKFYTEYFEIDYPLSKMDIIGVSDFAAGAMENWGLITFRNTDVFYSNLTASVESKQRVSEVIAHEIAHQWFGDLVTMKWWNDLWLNEGFATFMSYKCLSAAFPDFNSQSDFLNLIKISGLTMDSSNNTHPISNNFVKVIDIEASFDSITYDKGASVLNMLDTLMKSGGVDQFQIGIRNYLNKHQYSNAETADLWQELTKASNPTIQVDEIMKNWVTAPGLPYINVTSIKGGKALALSQHRYLGNIDSVAKDTTIWNIPISVATNCSISKSNMDGATTEIAIDLNECKYALFNNHANSFVRYKYDTETLNAIIHQMSRDINSLDPLGVVEFLDDQFSFVKAGLLQPSSAFEMASFLGNNTNIPATILSATLNGIATIGSSITEQECYPQFRQLQQSYFRNVLADFNYSATPTTYLDKVRFKTIIGLSNSAGITQTVEFLNKTWHDLKSTPEKINPDYRRSMYASIIVNGGNNEYNWVRERFLHGNNNEKTESLLALGQARQPYLVKRSLDMFMNGTVRIQDYIYLIRSLSLNSNGIDAAWRYFRENYEFFEKNLNAQSLGQFTNTIGGQFNSKILLQEFNEFVQGKSKIPEYFIKSTQEIIENNIKWLDRYATPLCSYLHERFPDDINK